jgi:branched-chain amino acid transport system permease protein
MLVLPSPRSAVALAILAALALLPTVLPPGSPFLINFGCRVMVFAIAAISLDLILGYGGMISFGHAAYFGIGGYAVAISSYYGITNGWLHFSVAFFGAATLSLLIGGVALRTTGVYFIMITLGLTQMLFYLGISLAEFGGDDGFTTQRSVFTRELTLRDPVLLYYLAFAILVVVLLVFGRLVASPFGIALRAAKSNELRAESLGVWTFPYKLTAFVIAGAVCGLAGALFVNLKGFMTPAYMYWTRSGDLIVMLLMGGTRTLVGPLVGALLFETVETFLPDLLDQMIPGQGRNWPILFGPALILLVFYFRGGLMNALPTRWPSNRK